MSLTPKNWKNFQHYSDRKPAWIKLHRGLLDDFNFARLPLASQALAPRLWLLASEYEEGKITAGLDEIAFRVHITVDELVDALEPLVSSGFFIDDSDVIAECKRDACLEKERETQEETEKEEDISSLRSDDVSRGVRKHDDWPKDYREQFWSKYPRKVAKKPAMKALDRIYKSDSVSWSAIVAGIGKMPIGEAKFIPHPASWLNAERWNDEILPGESNGPRGSRALQDDSRSVSVAADRLAEQIRQAHDRGEIVEFAPRPSLLPRESQDDQRLLPPGRSA